MPVTVHSPAAAIQCDRSPEIRMAFRTWRVEKIQYCAHVGHEIALENELVYPAEHLPEQPPRIMARRCSSAIECNLMEKAACALCGTNPAHEPV